MIKERKLNIFDALNKLSIKDRSYYESLSEDEKKEFLPVVIMRWLAGTTNARQIYFLNEIANPYMFDLFKHKELLAKLLTVSTSGRSQRYNWIKGSSKKVAASLIINLVEEYYGYTTGQAKQVLPLLDENDILAMAEAVGRQKDEIAKLNKELKALKDE